MMPPTSIDGTDITGATIDGTEVTEITVDGQTVFTAEKIVDDFEHNNLSGFYSNTSSESIVSSPVFEGSFALECVNGMNRIVLSEPGDGLANYIEKGTVHEWYWNLDGNNGQPYWIVGADGQNEWLHVTADGKNNTMAIRTFIAGSFGSYNTNGVTPPSSGWFKNELTWDDGTLGGSDDDFRWEMYDTSGSSLGTITLNDSTFASNKGHGFWHSSNGPSYIDAIKII